MDDPEIIINGTKLNFGQAMAVIHALNWFRTRMSEKDVLGKDEMDHKIAESYQKRLTEVAELMIEKPKT